MAIYSGFSHEKWWFSIATLNYQRVTINNHGPHLGTPKTSQTPARQGAEGAHHVIWTAAFDASLVDLNLVEELNFAEKKDDSDSGNNNKINNNDNRKYI